MQASLSRIENQGCPQMNSRQINPRTNLSSFRNEQSNFQYVGYRRDQSHNKQFSHFSPQPDCNRNPNSMRT